MKDIPLAAKWAAAMTPVAAVLIAAVMAYGALVQEVDDLRKELDEHRESNLDELEWLWMNFDAHVSEANDHYIRHLEQGH